MHHEADSLRRLAAMGIQVWQRRDLMQSAEAMPLSSPAQATPEPGLGDATGVRIRLSSGDGDWLLVQRQPWRGQHEKLLGDIRATLGAERCRFGQWSTDSAAGENAAELSERGVRHILSFGLPPRDLDWPGLLVAPDLDQLLTEAAAKRALWQLLAPKLGH
jgi:hypothetical protein